MTLLYQIWLESIVTVKVHLEFPLISDGTYYNLGYYDSNSDNLTWTNNEKWPGMLIQFNLSSSKLLISILSMKLYFFFFLSQMI